MTTAKAAVFTGPDAAFSLRDYPLTPPAPGTARLRLIASGLCGTDVHIHRGKLGIPPPMVIGHEFVGRVEAINDADDSGISVGDAAIVCVAVPCGTCVLCQSGDEANCVNMGVTYARDPGDAPHFHGGFAEVSYSPLANLIKIPANLDPRAAAVCACAGPTVLHALKLARRANAAPERARAAVVQGLGPVGMFAVARLAAMGIPYVAAVTGRTVEDRAQKAKELGASACFGLDRYSMEDIAGEIRVRSGGLGADLALEASGNPRAFAQGLTLLRNRGVYLVPGQYSDSGGVAIEPQRITFQALQILGSSQYDREDVADYLAFLQARPDICQKLGGLATAYPLTRVNEAFDAAKAGKHVKILLTPDE